jgi:hypothetical protein
MEQSKHKISKLLVEVCEELLPNTREANNTKIKKILKLSKEHLENNKNNS